MEVSENACPAAPGSSERYERDRTRSIKYIEVSYLVLAFKQPVNLVISTSDLFPFLSVCTSHFFPPLCLYVPQSFPRSVCLSLSLFPVLSVPHSFSPFCLSALHIFSFPLCLSVPQSFPLSVYLSLTSCSLSVCLPLTSFPFLSFSVCLSLMSFPFLMYAPQIFSLSVSCPSHLFPFLSVYPSHLFPFCVSVPHIFSPFHQSVPHIFSTSVCLSL